MSMGRDENFFGENQKAERPKRLKWLVSGGPLSRGDLGGAQSLSRREIKEVEIESTLGEKGQEV